MDKKNKVLLLSNIVLVGFVIAVMFHYVLGFYMKLDCLYNSFLYSIAGHFDDFTSLLPKLKGFAPYVPPADWQQYFPLTYLIMTPFAFIKNSTVAYLLFASIFVGFFSYWNIKFLNCKDLSKMENLKNIFILSLISYPFLFILDRGNFDMIIFIFFTLFIITFQSKKYQRSAIFLGIVNALKPFHFIFLLIFLFEKRYREFFLSLGVSFLLIIGGFMVFHGNIFEQISVMLQSWLWAQQYAISGHDDWINTTSTLYSFLKQIFCVYFPVISVPALIGIYKYISFLLTGITIFFTWKEHVLWKRITLLTLLAIVAPFFIGEYKLIFLFVPMWLFINSKEKTKFDVIYTILFGLLLIPKKYIALLLWGKTLIIKLSVLVNPPIILLFMGLIIYEQFVSNKKVERLNMKDEK